MDRKPLFRHAVSKRVLSVMPDDTAIPFVFRFFNEWLEMSGPNGMGPAGYVSDHKSTSPAGSPAIGRIHPTAGPDEQKIVICVNIFEGHGGFECEVRSGHQVHWQHDLYEWVDTRRPGGLDPKWEAEKQSSWADVADPTTGELAGAAAAFLIMTMSDVNGLLENGWLARILPSSRGDDVRTLEVKKMVPRLAKANNVRARLQV